MQTLIQIIDILAWPVTILIALSMLREPISKLVPALKKLKYKDLELEFEKEANRILAEAERDLPEIPEKPKKEIEGERRVLFSRRQVEPATQILESWRNLEMHLRVLAEHNKLNTGKSVRSLIKTLEESNLISTEAMKILLDLSALRNKVAHSDEEVITFGMADAYEASVTRVTSTINEQG